MDDKFQKLYQEVVINHTRNPNNFYKIEDGIVANGENPMCGDFIDVYVKLDGDKIIEVSFEGSGCAISKSSASVMTNAVRGMSIDQAIALYEDFEKLVEGVLLPEDADASMGELLGFAGIAQYPTRVRCALLAWSALSAAFEKVKNDEK